MVKIPNGFRLQKGEKIVFKWIVNLNPHLFGTSEFRYLESPLFETGGAAFKFCLFPWFRECPGKVTCLLTREDQHISELLYYLVDSEVTINKKILKQPANVYDFVNYESKYLPLMDLSDLRNKNNYPSQCKLTIQFGFQRCIIKKICPDSFLAITDLWYATESRVSSFGKPYASETRDESVEEHASRNDVAENGENELTQNIPLNTRTPHIRMFLKYSIHQNSLRIIFSSQKHSVFLRYKIHLFDKRNILIASKVEENILLRSENWFSNLVLPRCLKEEIEKYPSILDALRVYTNISLRKKKFTKDSEFEFGSSFSSNERKYFDLKADLKNLNRNRTRRADICIKNDERTFEAHRSILAARSPVFKAMLQNDTLESRTGVLKIVELNSEELRLFLSFIYSSDIDEGMRYEYAASLYAAADKYGIPSLSRVCRRVLKKNISLDNLHELLLLSHLHKDAELKEFVIKFLSFWYPNSDVVSNLNSMVLDRPLTEEDIEFFEGLSSFYRLMPGKNDAFIEEIPRLRSCKLRR